jgi:hypothetical protein
LTREDLREAIRDVTATVNRGFDGVHERLDVLNGKTGRHESAIAVHEERWQRLDRATSVPLTPPKGLPADLVKGDWKTLSMMGSLAAGAVSGLIWGLFKIVQVLQTVVR